MTWILHLKNFFDSKSKSNGKSRKVIFHCYFFSPLQCCYSCNPHKEYIRLFDVTEKTGVRRHTTGRRCRTCGSLLTDTIVHFGEKGKIKSPYRWKEAVRAAKNADLILCLGSSLKVSLFYCTT